MTDDTTAVPHDKTATNRNLRFLSRTAQIEEAMLPILPRATLWVVTAIVLAGLVLFNVTSINEIAQAKGQIEPLGQERDIRHPTGGIVAALHVSEGEHIEDGQPILTLRNTDLERDLARALERSRALEIEVVALNAYLAENPAVLSSLASAEQRIAEATYLSRQQALNDQILVLKEQSNQKDRELQILTEQLELSCDLVKTARAQLADSLLLYERGFATKRRFLDAQQQVQTLQSDISVIETRIESAKSAQAEFASRIDAVVSADRAQTQQALNATKARFDENAHLVEKLILQQEALVVRATASGVLKGMEVASVGGLVDPAITITKIVPTNEQLLVNVRIDPENIGRLSEGSLARLRISAYDFEQFGTIDGTVTQISAASFIDETGRRYYTAKIVPDRLFIGSGATRYPIAVGMSVDAQIVTGTRTVMQYLLQPVIRAMSSAMTEA
jgi:HlyD family secretion protein/adhesin transport system membrane fusion protein